MAYCHHPFRRVPVDVRSPELRARVADFDDSWPECEADGCDERVNPRRVALVGCRCLLHGQTKLEAMAVLSRSFVPAGAKQGETYVANAAKHVRGIHKGANQGG